MQAGQISAGNAKELADLIWRQRWDDLERWLGQIKDAARARGCEDVLLSSEWLLGALANQGSLLELCDRCQRSGLESVNMLLLLRDPADQLISHYKHRAKFGQAGSLGDWADKHYLLPARLAGLRAQLDSASVDLTVRSYSKCKGSLESVFFKDWLDIAPAATVGDQIVNPSLSLSELKLLRKLRGLNPDLVPYLYDRLLGVEPGLKAKDKVMGDHARHLAARVVARHAGEWAHWNARLSTSEKLSFPEPAADAAPAAAPNVYTFSETQAAAVTGLMAELATPGFLMRLKWRSRVRPALSWLRRMIRRDGSTR